MSISLGDRRDGVSVKGYVVLPGREWIAFGPDWPEVPLGGDVCLVFCMTGHERDLYRYAKQLLTSDERRHAATVRFLEPATSGVASLPEYRPPSRLRPVPWDPEGEGGL